MTFLDFFIVNVTLPSLSSDLHAGPGEVQLVVAGYGLAFAVGMISGGRLGDLYGRRRMFGVGLAAFTVLSAVCGLAPDPAVLIVARVLQGAAGALVTPQVLALLSTVYAGAQRARIFAAYGFTMGIAAVLGQLLGGGLISADLAGSGWRSIFLINVPVGVIALAVLRVVPESRGPRERLDLTGTALVSAGLVGVVAPLVEGRQYGWPWWTWCSFAGSAALLGGFVSHQRRVRRAGGSALMDLTLFARPGFRIGSAAGLVFGLVPASFFFVLAIYLQEARGLSPVLSGVVFTAAGAGYFVAATAADGVARRLGRQVLTLGAGAVAVGLLVLAATHGASSTWELVPGLVLVGAGIGFVLVPLSGIALADVPAETAGAAAGVLATGQQVGGAVGIAVIGVVFFGAADQGLPHAFAIAVLVLAGLTVLTALLAQALPRPVGASRDE
jgi:EmrB/QacA subfamily drug resistance transporter